MNVLDRIDARTEFTPLEDKLRETTHQLGQAFNQNEKLLNALHDAREQIATLRDEVDRLCASPSTYGVYHSTNTDDTVNVLTQGRKLKVTLFRPSGSRRCGPGRS